MKNTIVLFLLFSVTAFSQNFQKKWDKVVDYETDDQIKSASEIVATIYRQAKKQKNEVQIIKCFFYQSKYLQINDEKARSKILDNLQTEMKTASVPSKSILNLIYANCLNNYLSNKRYELYNRTKLDSAASGNFLTWTASDFEKEIDNAYKKTLENEAVLKTVKLEQYEPIFDFFENAEKQQSLYYYMIGENISHFSRKVYRSNESQAQLKKNELSLYGTSTEFTRIDLSFIENGSHKKVLQLYQQKEIIDASSDNQLARIRFINRAFFTDDTGYLKVLDRLQKRTANEGSLQKIKFEKAITYIENASKKEHPDYNIKAFQLFDSINNMKVKSNAYYMAAFQKNQLLTRYLAVNMQKFAYRNQRQLALVTYRNVDRIDVSFYKIDSKIAPAILAAGVERDSLLEMVKTKKTKVNSASYPLPNKGDYFQYTTEILLPQLENGQYLAVVEADGPGDKKAVAHDILNVTNMALLNTIHAENEIYTVLDRKTGKPIADAAFQTKSCSEITNTNGLATCKRIENNNFSDVILVSKAGDTLQTRRGHLNYYGKSRKEKEDSVSKVEFFLDRGIYRPGQTVYYKGIAVKLEDGVNSVIPKVPFNLIFVGADDDELKKIEVVTNEFGSFSGEFVLPTEGMTGEFTISAEEPDDLEEDPGYDKKNDEHPFWDHTDFRNSKQHFRVEEYKRPKFDIVFEPVKESYIIGQTVIVNGVAKAFAESAISNATVKYTVTKYPYYGPNRYNRMEKETVKTAETQTDAGGKFKIDFTSVVPPDFDKSTKPVFRYEVKAEITDLNGETRSGEMVVQVGFHSLELTVSTPPKIETKDANRIALNSTNLNHQFVPAKGEIKLYFISGEANKFIKRRWSKPEIPGISDAEFEQLFPYEDNLNEQKESPTGKLVYTKKIDTQTDRSIALDFISDYESGNYRWVFSAKDIYGNNIERISEFEIRQSKKRINQNELLTIRQLNANPKKDGFARLQIMSPVAELHLFTVSMYNNEVFFQKDIELKNHEAILEIPIQESQQYGPKIGFESLFENTYFSQEFSIEFQSHQDEMQFEAQSFRSKIEPGSTETWSFLLKSKPSTNAEVLATMYDSSLDQFQKSQWPSLAHYNYQYNFLPKRTGLGFGTASINLRNLNQFKPSQNSRSENPELMWFGFSFDENNDPVAVKKYNDQLSKKSVKPANAKRITGIVSEGNLPLPGVNIVVKDTKRGTQSDVDGNFEIEAAIGEQLVFSFIGMEDEIVTVTSSVMNVELFYDQGQDLAEVVVTSQGIKREKKALGYATTKITNNEFSEVVTIGDDLAMKFSGNAPGIIIRGSSSIKEGGNMLVVVDGVPIPYAELKNIPAEDIVSATILKGLAATSLYGVKAANGVLIVATTKKAIEELQQVKARTNLSETAFFFPDLKADANGKVKFSFKSPEALTQWRLRLHAHNKKAVTGYLENFVVTQKDLMVLPNLPRFLREKDTIVLTSKIANTTHLPKTGIAMLQFYDAVTMQPVDVKMDNAKNLRNFDIPAYGNTAVSWKIYVPEGLQGVNCRIVAKSGNFSDGEENLLPVLSNNMLLTEAIPLWVKGKTTKTYTFENLKNNQSTTLRNHLFTLEYCSNPTWLALQSLPYLMEFEHECAEQTFARFYANALASEVIASNPKIATLFDSWRKNDKLGSDLQQNDELKSIILAETPWLNDAKSETEKKKNLALLFDLEKMKTSQETVFAKLKQKQKSSGGFAWFDGGVESEYITRHILAGLGHLKKLNVKSVAAEQLNAINKTAIPFIDKSFLISEKWKIQNRKDKQSVWENPYSDLHYLYTRSFYLEDYPLNDSLKNVVNRQLEGIKSNWKKYALYEKGLAALTLSRFNEKETAQKILEGLRQTASNHEDWGMYWIDNTSGWYWYQAPIETQALLIEAFSEIENDKKSVEAMKVWLIKNRQAKNWPTTKSTTEAVYALLMQESDWLSVNDNTVINIGDEKILTRKLSENQKEAETGYLKMNWKGNEITKKMATVSIENKSDVPGYGGAYWQYFEELDKIKSNKGGNLSVTKELYLRKKTENGEVLQPITSANPLKVGDLVAVRLIISAKENMEYVHLKDMRGACFEPKSVLSAYNYRDGLGYYQSTKDAATHFFFDAINKGTYVLEYDLRVNNSGSFSNGITTIQSMYAPEYASHTKGIKVNVK